MKAIIKKFTALFLVLATMLSVFVAFTDFKKEKAYAFSEDYQPIIPSGIDNVYYFSDSAPFGQSI